MLIGETIEINVKPLRDKSYRSCNDCIHCEDSEEICILRKCVHAIGCLNECYKPRQRVSKRCSFIRTDCPYEIECEECEVLCSVNRAKERARKADYEEEI